jgi:hypothetical protein
MPAAGSHMKHQLGELHGAGSRRSPLPGPKRLVEVPRGQLARARRAAAERRAVHRPLSEVAPPIHLNSTSRAAGPAAGRPRTTEGHFEPGMAT